MTALFKIILKRNMVDTSLSPSPKQIAFTTECKPTHKHPKDNSEITAVSAAAIDSSAEKYRKRWFVGTNCSPHSLKDISELHKAIHTSPA